MSSHDFNERGASTGIVIGFVGLGLVAVIGLGLSIWAFVNYLDQKSNVDARVNQAVAVAEKAQADKDEKNFAQREKEPTRAFAGPEDYGSLGFRYPKTWSVYVASDGSDGNDFEAYLNPVTVPSVENSDERYALRVNILNTSYENVIDDYQSLVEQGGLRTSAIKANGQAGTRLDGKFSDDIRGAAVIYKIRDKTAVIRTDANTFKPDFEKLIKTITFNQ
jgi:hypothetical protein